MKKIIKNMNTNIKKFAILTMLNLLIGSINNRAETENSPIIFHQSKDTLLKVIDIIAQKKKGAYIRFGDGDINIACGQSDSNQIVTNKISEEMRQVLKMQGEYVLKALPLNCAEFGGLEKGMFPGNHEWPYSACVSFIKRVTPFWNAPLKDVYSAVALHFMATKDPNFCVRFLQCLKNSNTTLFIGNEHVPNAVKNALFGPNCVHIRTASRNAFIDIDRAEEESIAELSKDQNYKVVVLAMGCSGKVLIKRLWNKTDNVFFIDFGSLIDALCGWNTRAWIELTGFDKEKFLNLLSKQTHIICTSALIENEKDLRKTEYTQGVTAIKSFGFNPYIIESIAEGPTYLNQLSDRILYAKTNNFALKNKGVNEAMALIKFIDNCDFSDNDMIVKTTGRYILQSDGFLRLIEENPLVDSFVKKDAYGQVFTGCFALRYKYLKKFLHSLNLAYMEQRMINIERELANFLKSHGEIKVLEVQKLNLKARIGSDPVIIL